ncbi:UDP-N-acetylmuramoyl-tripeptide--D-alanyl-D-alanine ligase [uncultured Piscinibacter sp.]|uniref:UDP-N-acetylmuramoyl-tripeptide--D-alanyl-D- alanine ligase n=1 Tax=uncultured Piscinibacter sp. TaxID=1131835 RepID=UPI00261D959F|nr:UDP-N-acetylmuramoyl-tripeptide--D-alanyl-D-alanine ligase [uncultured Piscinibacter sp.]
MSMTSLARLYSLLPDARLVGDPATVVERVHTDTRSLHAGDLFVALRGEHFDAHDFLALAKTGGAVAAVAERGLEDAGLSGLEVADSGVALMHLGGGWRARHALPLIAVTGSNGKTTVTQMIAGILRIWLGDAALATLGNLNNQIGVPLTLLRLREHHRAAVVELGMNHPGEIAQLAAIAAPTVALVNNAQREHQEFMASVEAVARENGCVISALPPDGTVVFPADDAHAPLWRELAGARRVMRFATEGEAEVTGQAAWAVDHWNVTMHTPAGRASVALRVAGAHNVRNALAAAACALAAGCPLDAIVRGLQDFEPVKGRSQLRRILRAGRTITLVDDSYNANPDSVRAAIDVLAGLPGPRWLLLGDMGEVGDQGPAFHAEVGGYAKQRGIENLWTAGSLCRHAAQAFGGARHFDGVEALIAALKEAPPAASIVVKGSRFMRMERIVAALMEGAAHAA